ncbi:hypothetical protein RB201_37515 [Streptomyces sp. S1A(2023)]
MPREFWSGDRGRPDAPSAEHYVHLANTDPLLNQALQTIWVAGPGAAQPGLFLSEGEPMSREEAEALAIDLTRPVHTCRRRLLHLPARRRRERLFLEVGLPQLRQVRHVRPRPRPLAPQA